jgi:hypothetical protein
MSIILLLLLLLIVAGFVYFSNTSGTPAISPRLRNTICSKPESVEIAISGIGLSYLFAPSPLTLAMMTSSGLEDLLINDPRLIAFQKDYGPVDGADADRFAHQASYCGGTSEMLRPLGSVVAFVGLATKRPSLEHGFTRLVRIDAQGYRELCSGEGVSLIYLSGVLQDSKGTLVPLSFFLPVLTSQLETAASRPSMTTEFQGVQLHGAGSDSYWVGERLLALAEAFRWLSDIDRELLVKFKRLRQLAKTASENSLMENARPRINKALLETRDLCDQIPELLRDLEKRLKDVFDWVLLPEEFKDIHSIQEEQFDLGELMLVKDTYEEVASLVDLYQA